MKVAPGHTRRVDAAKAVAEAPLAMHATAMNWHLDFMTAFHNFTLAHNFGNARGRKSAYRPGLLHAGGAIEAPASRSERIRGGPSGQGLARSKVQMIRAEGYSIPSIVVHWIAAILVIALFFTHEGEPGSTAYVLHVSGGAIAGVFLLWRVWHRVRRGSTHPPEQVAVFNLAARLVHWGLLVAIVVVVVSGYLLPWSLGRELDVFGFGIPSPMAANRDLHEFVERVHDVSGHLFIPLLALHVLGAVKHAVFDWRRAGLRMFKPVDGGR